LTKKIEEAISRMYSSTEIFLKKEIIREVKYFSQLIAEETRGVEEQKKEVRELQARHRNDLKTSSPGLFSTADIN